VREVSSNDALRRVEAILKTGRDPGYESRAGAQPAVIKTGKLVVKLDTRAVEVDGGRLHVTGKEVQPSRVALPAQGHATQ
jgi:DNA-binding response OmpR family regulator